MIWNFGRGAVVKSLRKRPTTTKSQTDKTILKSTISVAKQNRRFSFVAWKNLSLKNDTEKCTQKTKFGEKKHPCINRNSSGLISEVTMYGWSKTVTSYHVENVAHTSNIHNVQMNITLYLVIEHATNPTHQDFSEWERWQCLEEN